MDLDFHSDLTTNGLCDLSEHFSFFLSLFVKWKIRSYEWFLSDKLFLYVWGRYHRAFGQADESYRLSLQKNVGPHTFYLKFQAVPRHPWKSLRGLQVANHWFCASFSLQASMKPMPSKSAFLLNPNQMKNLSICKHVFSTLSLTVQQSQSQLSRAVQELCYQGLFMLPCRLFPAQAIRSWWPSLFLIHTKVGHGPVIAFATYTWTPKYKVQQEILHPRAWPEAGSPCLGSVDSIN